MPKGIMVQGSLMAALGLAVLLAGYGHVSVHGQLSKRGSSSTLAHVGVMFAVVTFNLTHFP